MTTREQVRRLLATGLPDKRIAQATGRSLGTVKAHVRLILRETGSANRTAAAVRLVAGRAA